MPSTRKQNIKVAVKKSTVNFSLDLKEGEIGTDGENLFIGQANRIIAIAPPIGSVIPWNKFGFATTENGTPTLLNMKLPRGWIIADGRKINDPDSPFFSYHIANLTNDIFIQGCSIENVGMTGGTNDSSHKHNVAHHHTTNPSVGAAIVAGSHQHLYLDTNADAAAPGEESSGGFANPAGYDTSGWFTAFGGNHSHNIHSSPVADQSSGLYINSNNHMNIGVPRRIDDLDDFIENRPKYLSCIYIMRIG